MSDYFRLQVRDLCRNDEERFSVFCFDHGAEGVAEELAWQQPDAKYEPEIVEKDSCDVNVFFSSKPQEDFFLRLKGEFPNATLEPFVEQNRDWLAEWKKGFLPFVFVEPFWIVPSWCEKPEQAKEPLYVDPGMAFGTGTHETTRAAAELVIEAMKHGSPRAVLDVGTGTGILALVARRLGAERVVAIDNDPEARRVARENIEINRATNIEVPDQNLEDVTDTYDVVIANIIDGVLLELRPGLLGALDPSGSLVLSGILAEREDLFRASFLDGIPFEVIERRQLGEWVSYLLRRTHH